MRHVIDESIYFMRYKILIDNDLGILFCKSRNIAYASLHLCKFKRTQVYREAFSPFHD